MTFNYLSCNFAPFLEPIVRGLIIACDLILIARTVCSLIMVADALKFRAALL